MNRRDMMKLVSLVTLPMMPGAAMAGSDSSCRCCQGRDITLHAGEGARTVGPRTVIKDTKRDSPPDPKDESPHGETKSPFWASKCAEAGAEAKRSV
jgi:hypothetical protein